LKAAARRRAGSVRVKKAAETRAGAVHVGRRPWYNLPVGYATLWPIGRRGSCRRSGCRAGRAGVPKSTTDGLRKGPPIPPSARKRPGVAGALLGCLAAVVGRVAAVVGRLGAAGTRSHGCRDRPEASTRAFVAAGGRGGVAAD